MSKLPILMGATALALLTGCQGNQGASNVTTVVETRNDVVTVETNVADGGISNGAAPVAVVTLAGDGVGKATFAMSRESAVPLVEAALGPHTGQGTNPECGAGPLENVDFNGGLSLFFQDGKFVGWNIDGRNGSPYHTASGIGIGSTLEQLRAKGDVAVQDTSLGVEFTAGEISGLASANNPDGKITSLWAGTTCAFR